MKAIFLNSQNPNLFGCSKLNFIRYSSCFQTCILNTCIVLGKDRRLQIKVKRWKHLQFQLRIIRQRTMSRTKCKWYYKPTGKLFQKVRDH